MEKLENSKMMSAPDLKDIPIEKMLYALSDETRLKIVAIIEEAGGELPCGSFAEKTGVTKPTLSHHFSILRESGVIATRMEGNQKFNMLRKKELAKQFPGLLDLILKKLKKKKG